MVYAECCKNFTGSLQCILATYLTAGIIKNSKVKIKKTCYLSELYDDRIFYFLILSEASDF
jgi:hypothetical protein